MQIKGGADGCGHQLQRVAPFKVPPRGDLNAKDSFDFGLWCGGLAFLFRGSGPSGRAGAGA